MDDCTIKVSAERNGTPKFMEAFQSKLAFTALIDIKRFEKLVGVNDYGKFNSLAGFKRYCKTFLK